MGLDVMRMAVFCIRNLSHTEIEMNCCALNLGLCSSRSLSTSVTSIEARMMTKLSASGQNPSLI